MNEKITVITGGSSGLGYQMARSLALKGDMVIILARNKERLNHAVQSIKNDGGNILGFPCDVTDQKALAVVYEAINSRYGRIDFLIVNHGISRLPKLFEEFEDYDELKSEIDVNLWGAVLVTHMFLPLLNRGSRILMISSGFGLVGAAGAVIYSASKAGMVNFAEALRRELLYKGILVSVACIPDVDTPMYREEIKDPPEWMKAAAVRESSVLSAETAAKRVLKKCKGKRFLIIISGNVWLLNIASRLLPRRLRDYLVDVLLPRPKA